MSTAATPTETAAWLAISFWLPQFFHVDILAKLWRSICSPQLATTLVATPQLVWQALAAIQTTLKTLQILFKNSIMHCRFFLTHWFLDVIYIYEYLSFIISYLHSVLSIRLPET